MSDCLRIASPCLYNSWTDFNNSWQQASKPQRAELILNIVQKVAIILAIISFIVCVGYFGGYPLAQVIQNSHANFIMPWLVSTGKLAIGPTVCLSVVLFACIGKWGIGVYERAHPQQDNV